MLTQRVIILQRITGEMENIFFSKSVNVLNGTAVTKYITPMIVVRYGSKDLIKP